MPSLKNIRQKRQDPEVRHSRSKKCNKLSSSIEDIDYKYSILKIDLYNAIKERSNKKVEVLLIEAKAAKALKGLFLCDATSGDNILHIASQYGNHRILKMLLDVAKIINKDDVTLRDLLLSTNQLGENALHIAASSNNNMMAIELLDSAKNINDNDKTLIDLLLSTNDLQRTALHISATFDSAVTTLEILNYTKAINDKHETLQILIESYDEHGRTALHTGALYGHIYVITDLLDAAKIAGESTLQRLLLCRDIDQCNALHTTSINGYAKVATALLDAAKNVSINTARRLILDVNNLNENVLHISADNRNDTLLTKLLNIASNLSVNEYKHEQNVLQKLLLTYTASGESPLHIAAHNINEKLVLALLNAIKNMQGSDNILHDLLFYTDYSGENPLYISISNENPSIFSNILNSVKNLDYITFQNLLLFRTGPHDSVLYTLVSKKKIKLVESLLHTIKDLANVTYNNAIKGLGKYINIIKEINTYDPKSIKHIKCDDETKLNQIIECFNKNMLNPTDDIIHNDYLYRVKYINSKKCIDEIGCFNTAGFINNYRCAKAIEYIEDKNNMLIRVLLYRDTLGYNILHSAASNGYYEAISTLLNEAKYIDAWKYNSTARYTTDNKCIDVVTENHGQILVEDLLKEIKSNNTIFTKYLFSTTRSEENNILHIAVQEKDIKLVRKLLRYAENVGDNNPTLKNLLVSTNKSGNTALHIAVQEKDTKIVSKLLRYAKNIEANNITLKKLLVSINELGDTALHIAAQEKDTKIVGQLLRYAKNIGDNNTTLKKLLVSINELADTALHIAAQTHNTQIVDKLLRYAKNIEDNNITLKDLLTSTNKLGETALCVAYYHTETPKCKCSSTVALLITEAEKVGIIQAPVKMYCITNNDKLQTHVYNLDSNTRIKRDIEHKQKGITHHHDNDNTQGTISTTSPILTRNLKFNTLKSIPHSTDNYNTVNNQVAISDLNIGGILMFLHYFFPKKLASGTHYISPHTQHAIELDELASKVELLLGEVVHGGGD